MFRGPVQEMPVFHSRVELDPTVKDHWGIPTLRLSGRPHPHDQEVARFIAARAEEVLKEAGAVRTWVNMPGTGGPSGGCISSDYLDTPVDFESLSELGSIMGSGGLVIVDDQTGMPDFARFFMDFCVDESCGKCVPCRVGTVQIRSRLDKIIAGKANADDLVALEALCERVQTTSLCGLGISAPNPVISTLKYFRDEYEELLVEPQNGNVRSDA